MSDEISHLAVAKINGCNVTPQQILWPLRSALEETRQSGRRANGSEVSVNNGRRAVGGSDDIARTQPMHCPASVRQSEVKKNEPMRQTSGSTTLAASPRPNVNRSDLPRMGVSESMGSPTPMA